MLMSACAGAERPTTKEVVVTEYFLEQAGFKKLDVNMETPQRQALLNAIPRGKIITYRRDGKTYHVFGSEGTQTIYLGDEAAYQRYLATATGRQLCERVDASESSKFWACYDEYQQKGGGGQPGK
jgi:hypothetical protein